MGKKVSKKEFKSFLKSYDETFDIYEENVDTANVNAENWDEALRSFADVIDSHADIIDALERRVEMLEEDLDDAHEEINALKAERLWSFPSAASVNTDRIKDFFDVNKSWTSEGSDSLIKLTEDALKGAQTVASGVSSFFKMNDPYNKNKSNDEG